MNVEKPVKTHLSILFTLVALSSFSAGLLFGLLLPFNLNKPSEQLTETKQQTPDTSMEQENTMDSDVTKDKTPQEPKSQKESLNRYRKMLEKTVQSELSQFPELHHYGIVIGSYTTMDQANGVSIDLKKQYPEWSISVYPLDQVYKVVIGSFTDKVMAQEFLKNLPKKSQFLKAQVIQIPNLK